MATWDELKRQRVAIAKDDDAPTHRTRAEADRGTRRNASALSDKRARAPWRRLARA